MMIKMRPKKITPAANGIRAPSKPPAPLPRANVCDVGDASFGLGDAAEEAVEIGGFDPVEIAGFDPAVEIAGFDDVEIAGFDAVGSERCTAAWIVAWTGAGPCTEAGVVDVDN